MLASTSLRPGLLVIAALALPAAAPAAEPQAAKAVSVASPWARATPGGTTIGAAYLEFSAAAGSSGDKLIGASSPAAARIEIHTHEMAGGVMKMRKVDAVGVAAGQSHKLQPGGDHLMLFDLKAPLKEGDILPLTLKFENAGEVTVDAGVQSVGAMAPGAAGTAPGAGKTGMTGMEGSDAGSHEGQ